MTKRCKDCLTQGIASHRKASYPGPRCATHHREFKKTQSAGRHAAHIDKQYGLTPDEYEAIYQYQGRKCYICQRATGQRKRLAVDHDHVTGVVRGLLCGTCNRKVLGHLRDDPAAFARGKRYLENPPAVAAIGMKIVPIDGAPVKGRN